MDGVDFFHLEHELTAVSGGAEKGGAGFAVWRLWAELCFLFS
jgi:hypothetical protein